MSKILIITNHSYMLYRFRLELIQELMKSHEVVLSMPFVGHEDDFKALGLKCIHTEIDRRGVNPKTDFKLLMTYYKQIRQEKPDLVITYSIKPNIYAGLVCTWLKIPYCVNVQGMGTAFDNPKLRPFVSKLYRAAVKNVKVAFFENAGNKEDFWRYGILEHSKGHVTRGAGINVDQYPYVKYPENDVFRFLYLGRIMKEKGMDELFESIEMLYEDGLKFVVDLVGFFEDEYKEKVEEYVKRGLVVYHGFQSDPRPYYAAADCVVLPSYHEGLSNVLLEGACTGRPLITSNIDGCRQALLGQYSGYLCEPRNTKSLYAAMKRMMKATREERDFMGVTGHRFVTSTFDRRLVVDDVIKQLMK